VARLLWFYPGLTRRELLHMDPLEVLAYEEEMERLDAEGQLAACAAANPSKKYVRKLMKQARGKTTKLQDDRQHRRGKRQALMAGHAMVLPKGAAAGYVAEWAKRVRGKR